MAAKKKTSKRLEYVIVRCTAAGVHAGYLEKATATHVTLRQARRIWYWNGAASLNEIAVYGLNPSKAASSKIAVPVRRIRLRDQDVCEVIVCEEAGRQSVEGAPLWRA